MRLDLALEVLRKFDQIERKNLSVKTLLKAVNEFDQRRGMLTAYTMMIILR